MKRGIRIFAPLCMAVIAFLTVMPLAHADTSPVGDFNLQVTPSPLVLTVLPGAKSVQELKIRNGGSATEKLKIEPRAFTLTNDSTSVNLLDTTPPDIANWISFSQPKFTINPGEWFSEKISFSVPKNAGFSYSFALLINRQADPQPTEGGRLIKGSVAIFTLVNVNRPGAISSLQVTKFVSNKRLYEYLPATFSVTFHNTGNTIVQPYGNIFVQRNAKDTTPLGSLVVNETKGYILPGTTRTITATWDDGFPVYTAVSQPDGSTKQKLIWNWANLAKLRIGRYSAHLVGVYNQNGRDVPIEGNVTFWVIPWRLLLIPLAILLLILFALFMVVRGIIRKSKRVKAARHEKKQAHKTVLQTPPDQPAA